jgi:SsrA-binding protein
MATKKKSKDDANGLIAENRRARYEYALTDTFEAGIELTGTEVKSLRQGQANIAESYVAIENGEVVLINANIPEYQLAGPFFNHEPRRPRRLLLHKKEIARLAQAVERQGMTIVPLRLFFNHRGLVKLQIAVAQGKKMHDKRETERKRDWQRQKARLLRERG